jgi:hypothetical protein
MSTSGILLLSKNFFRKMCKRFHKFSRDTKFIVEHFLVHRNDTFGRFVHKLPRESKVLNGTAQ